MISRTALLLERKQRARARDPKDHPELWNAVSTLADPSSHSDHVRSASEHLNARFAGAAGSGSRIAHEYRGRVHTPDAAQDSIQTMHSGLLSKSDPRTSADSLRSVASQYYQKVRSGEVEHHPRVFAGFVRKVAWKSTNRDLSDETARKQKEYQAQKEINRRRRQSPTAPSADPADQVAARDRPTRVGNALRGHVATVQDKRHRNLIHDYLDHHLADNYAHGRSARAKADEKVMTSGRLAAKHGLSTKVVSTAIKDFHRSAANSDRIKALAAEWTELPRTLAVIAERCQDARLIGISSVLRAIFGG